MFQVGPGRPPNLDNIKDRKIEQLKAKLARKTEVISGRSLARSLARQPSVLREQDCLIALIKKTTAPRQTFLPRNRADGGVGRFRTFLLAGSPSRQNDGR